MIKRWLEKSPRLLPLLLVAILTCVVAVPATYALAPTKQITGEIEIVLGTKEVQVYQGPDYSIPISRFAVVAPRGSQVTLNFRVKNTGLETITQAVHMVPATVPWGTLTLSATNLGVLAPGQQTDWSLTISIPVSTAVGKYTVTMELYEP